MSLTRRAFIQSAGALTGSIALPFTHASAASKVPFHLKAGVFRQTVRATGEPSEVWGFNGSVPGPVLRFKQGEMAHMRVLNRLPRSTTVHWHGLRVPNAMDGVPMVTQEPIPVGGGFDYRFRCSDAGTYWYHPHQSSFEQVPRGLYGMFIVDEDKPLQVDREVLWVLSDFKLDSNNQPVEDFGKILDFGSGGRLGNTFAINGTAAGSHRALKLRPGERIRLRLLNAASARIFLLDFTGHEPWVVSYDGQGVVPHRLDGGKLLLGCGQRTDLVLDATQTSGSFAVMDRRNGGTEIARVVYDGKPVRSKALAAPKAIAPNNLTEPNLDRATDHFVVFEGGILGAPAIAMVDGKALDIKTIMERHGLTWSMNYTAQHEHAMMHEPLFRLRRGEHATIKMINNTDFEHPMHMHGHFFKVLAMNDQKLARADWRDTVMMGAHSTCDIAFVAENVGEWMFHCHILDHAAGGMMGTLAVLE